jgi:hypothetical protein
MQSKKTKEEVQSILANIEFMDRKIILLDKEDGFLLQVQYYELDIDDPSSTEPSLQKARKWYLSPYSTDTEVVETAFKACRVSMEHVLKEHFLYKGRRVYSPHFDIEARIKMCDNKSFDGRK